MAWWRDGVSWDLKDVPRHEVPTVGGSTVGTDVCTSAADVISVDGVSLLAV